VRGDELFDKMRPPGRSNQLSLLRNNMLLVEQRLCLLKTILEDEPTCAFALLAT
jgi:hypothetical protein